MSSQGVVHRPGCDVPHAGYHVAVGVEGDADVGVPEHLGDDLRVDALREQQGGAGVPQVVEANVRQPRLLEERLEVPRDEVLRVVGRYVSEWPSGGLDPGEGDAG